MVLPGLTISGSGVRTVASRRVPRKQALLAGASALAGALLALWGGVAALRADDPFGADYPEFRWEMRVGGAAMLLMAAAMAAIGTGTVRRALASRDGSAEVRLPTLGIPPDGLMRAVTAAAALVMVLGTVGIQRLVHAVCRTTGLAERELPAFVRSPWTVVAAIVLGAVAVAAAPSAPRPRWRAWVMASAFAAGIALFAAIGFAVVRVAWAHMTLES